MSSALSISPLADLARGQADSPKRRPIEVFLLRQKRHRLGHWGARVQGVSVSTSSRPPASAPRGAPTAPPARTVRAGGRVDPSARGDPRRWGILAVVALAQLMIAIDTSIVNTLTARLQQDLGLSTASLAWVVNIYVLFFGGLLLPGGRLADVFGRPHMFLSALV